MEAAAETTIFLLRPFFIALYIGLFFALVIFIREKAHQKKLNKENEMLKQHIQTKLMIEAETNERMMQEIEELKNQNENLRITVQSLSEKPGRKEIKTLAMYQKAVEILTEKAPGFAQSWQSALKDGKDEMRKIDLGFIPFVKKLLPGKSTRTKSIEDRSVSSEK